MRPDSVSSEQNGFLSSSPSLSLFLKDIVFLVMYAHVTRASGGLEQARREGISSQGREGAASGAWAPGLQSRAGSALLGACLSMGHGGCLKPSGYQWVLDCREFIPSRRQDSLSVLGLALSPWTRISCLVVCSKKLSRGPTETANALSRATCHISGCCQNLGLSRCKCCGWFIHFECCVVFHGVLFNFPSLWQTPEIINL